MKLTYAGKLTLASTLKSRGEPLTSLIHAPWDVCRMLTITPPVMPSQPSATVRPVKLPEWVSPLKKSRREKVVDAHDFVAMPPGDKFHYLESQEHAN